MTKTLSLDIREYQAKRIAQTASKIKRTKTLFIILNVFIVLAGLAAATISTLIISKEIYTNYPDWYFFVTAGASAFALALGSMLNFFSIKPDYEKHKKNLKKIEAEIVLYENKLTDEYKSSTRDYDLFLAIEVILGSVPAKKEVEYG